MTTKYICMSPHCVMPNRNPDGERFWSREPGNCGMCGTGLTPVACQLALSGGTKTCEDVELDFDKHCPECKAKYYATLENVSGEIDKYE